MSSILMLPDHVILTFTLLFYKCSNRKKRGIPNYMCSGISIWVRYLLVPPGVKIFETVEFSFT